MEGLIAFSFFWLSSWFGLGLAVWKFVATLDSTFEQLVKDELAEAILYPNRLHDWLPDFVTVFDQIFGTKHLSMRCFFRSLAVTCVAFATIMVAWFLGMTENRPEEPELWTVLAASALWGPILNAIPDYLSLLVTRKVLGMPWSNARKLVVDLLGTSIVSFSIPLVVLMTVVLTLEGGDFEIVVVVIIVAAVSVPTGFVTSVWLWAHAAANIAAQVIPNAVLVSRLEVLDRPFNTIGLVTGVILFLVGIATLPVVAFMIVASKEWA